MANYLNGKPLSGLNSVPELTLAQYNALNVKPEFWVRTDAPESYKKLSADQVSYDSNTTVKDKIDAIAIKYTDITETTDSSGRVLLASSIATTDNFINALPLSIGSTFIKVAKRYNSETATAIWLSFVDSSNSAITNTSIKFRVFYF